MDRRKFLGSLAVGAGLGLLGKLPAVEKPKSPIREPGKWPGRKCPWDIAQNVCNDSGHAEVETRICYQGEWVVSFTVGSYCDQDVADGMTKLQACDYALFPVLNLVEDDQQVRVLCRTIATIIKNCAATPGMFPNLSEAFRQMDPFTVAIYSEFESAV